MTDRAAKREIERLRHRLRLCLANYEAAWQAFGLVREALEEHLPPAAILPAAETEPTFLGEAEQLVRGIHILGDALSERTSTDD